MILLNRSANKKTYLRLKKQLYHCRSCQRYFTARTYLVNPSYFISKQVHYTILEELTERQATKTIVKRCEVSVTTVQRTLSMLAKNVRQNLNYLPKCLLFDEFDSFSTTHGKSSFSCMDGDTGKLFNILPSRRKKAFFGYEQGITLALEKKYFNAKLKSLHTRIKTLKCLSYGFRSFSNMRLRIFLINNLISYK